MTPEGGATATLGRQCNSRNSILYTNKKKTITTPAYVTMPFPTHPAPTTDPCMDFSLVKAATAMCPSWAPALA
jgi:hypothetical protein